MQVERVDGKLTRVPLEWLAEHGQVDPRILVAGEPDVADLARLSRLDGCFQATLFEDPVRIVVIDDFVKLPEVDPVRLKPPQAVVRHFIEPA